MKSDYHHPVIKTEFLPRLKIRAAVKSYFVQLCHSLLPHGDVEEPKRQLPNFPEDMDDSALDFCKLLYDTALNSIKTAEEKGFKLLSYSSALMSVLIFMFSETSHEIPIVQWVIAVSAFLTTLSLIISFRCLKVKTMKVVDFEEIVLLDSEQPSSSNQAEYHFSKNELAYKYVKLSHYNQTVANSTIDMIKAAQKTIALAAFCIFIGFVGFAIDARGTRDSQNQLDLQDIKKQVKSQQLMIKDLQLLMNDQKRKVILLDSRLDSVLKQLNTPNLKQNNDVKLN